jgi:hypothetical protein
MSQREIIDALEEELRLGGKPLKLTVSEVKPDGPALFKLFIDSADSSHGLDESLEGAAASWPGRQRGQLTSSPSPPNTTKSTSGI